METNRQYRYLQPRLSLILFFRLIGYVGIALLCLLFPQVGDNRFALAGLIAFVALPAVLVLNVKFNGSDRGWTEPLLDLFVTVAFVHLVPEAWFVALCVGLMVALAPSVSLHPRSYRIYGAFALILVGGLGLAALVHDVEGWLLPLLTVAVVYPSVVFHAHWQVRRADALRERAQFLQNLNHLAGSVAHDFNNVLAGVSGHAELAIADLPEDHPAVQAMEEVINGASRASLLCGQLLSFSNQNGSGLQALELGAELRTLVGLLEPVVPKGVRIETEYAGEQMWVKADKAQLQQVIMNVVLNAGEASAELPAKVAVMLELSSRNGDALAVIKVRDSGQGIADEDLEQVFDPFFTTKEKGHGLGLASARRIVQMHEGDIHIASMPGVGTTVTISLPVTERPGADVSAVDARGSEHDKQRPGMILIVDDEPSVREVVVGLLELAGYLGITAQNGDEALQVFREHQDEILAVLLDLKMPGMDGWHVLNALHDIRSDLPVLICSGYDPDERSAEDMPERVRFLSKPFRAAELELALEELLLPTPEKIKEGA